MRRIFICACLFVFSFFPGLSQASDLTTSARQAIVVDYNTGTVLFEHNPDERMPTSSMSKVMTMYAVFGALKSGALSLDDQLLVSEKAWRMGGSKMFVPVGEKVKVEDLIRGVIVQSGNDATIVLAEGLAGDETSFAASLTAKAKDLGMDDSRFMNASGWPDPDHYSTARDLATLAAAMIRDFPEYYGYYAEKEFMFGGIKQGNRNPLLYKNIGADGIKTGHTEDGGYGLIGTGVRDGRRVIVVVNGLENSKEREEESARLLQWGLNGFEVITLFKGDQDLDTAPVYLGVKDKVGLKVREPIDVLVPKLYRDDLKVEVSFKSPLKAPVAKGTQVGVARIHIPKGGVKEVDLITTHDVAELNFFLHFLAKARLVTTGKASFVNVRE
ncbi:MAG: D-alanyl-D-alanine carboxypeptidase [Alphaproteobacteria bacterium]|nr:D-alanyl-D-alanine carboxypeptidase [Alphaproteobacteria bacterium]